MSQSAPAYRNLWALTVLCLLRERPLHPYEMQRLLHERHKDDLLELKRGSLYHAIARLERADLIEPMETSRAGRRPERTVYRLTAAGEDQMVAWLREMIAVPAGEPSEFMGALSHLLYLRPAEALERLRDRQQALEAQVMDMDNRLSVLSPRITRINVLEIEYARAMRRAERDWVRSLADDLEVGRLTWDSEAIFHALRGAATLPELSEQA